MLSSARSPLMYPFMLKKVQIALRIVIVGVCKERLHLKPLVHEPRVEKATGPMQQDVELCPLDEQYREESGSLLRTAANLFPTVRAISAGALVEVWSTMFVSEKGSSATVIFSYLLVHLFAFSVY